MILLYILESRCIMDLAGLPHSRLSGRSVEALVTPYCLTGSQDIYE